MPKHISEPFYLITSLMVLLSSGLAANAQTSEPIPTSKEQVRPQARQLNRADNMPISKQSAMAMRTLDRKDTHTFARPTEVVVTHLDLDLTVLFDKKIVKGTATYDIDRKEGNVLVLDTRGLEIAAVTDGKGQPLTFKLEKEDPIKGQALSIVLTEGVNRVKIAYATTAASDGLQWLNPEQVGGKTPFLYTQGQAILTRTWIPVQDSPDIRMTYRASVNVPNGMMAVMSAMGNVAGAIPGQTTFDFKQPHPIPAYLIALAVGELEFKRVTENAGIYALPHVLPSAVGEFAELGKFMDAAVGLCGPYLWDRFDVLVLPSSFPFGGMENPMLTFATPTLLAGDRSLVSVIIHEMAHSWSGNLVTNANWNDFWLNEGWTVYLERRIVEAIYGKDMADIMEVLGFQDLKSTIANMPKGHPDTGLRLRLEGRDPDDGMTDVAYERGAMVIKELELAWGRDAFDPFIKSYFEKYRFKSITTEEFIRYAQDHSEKNKLKFPNLMGMVQAVGEPMPTFKVHADRLIGVEKARVAFLMGKDIGDMGAGRWSAQEKQYFLRILIDDLSASQLATIEKIFGLKESKNAEVIFEWFMLCIRNGHKDIMPQLQEFLGEVGRRKFVLPLYKAMFAHKEWSDWGRKLYAKNRTRYHSITAGSVDKLLQ
jgi:leukotriene-A4 hydrolase